MWFSSGALTIWGMGVIGGALHNILQSKMAKREEGGANKCGNGD